MRHLLLILLLTAVLAAVFYHYPQIDLDISASYYTPGIGFFPKSFKEQPLIFGLAHIHILLMAIFGIGIFLSFLFQYQKCKSLHFKYYLSTLYVVSVCLMGPLISTFIVKNIVGRPRPLQIEQFGGNLQFMPAFHLSNQCTGDCSFVSRHTTLTLMTISLPFLIRSRRKRVMVLGGAIALGALAGYSRIALGYHFLSDVVFAGILMYLTAYIMALLFKLESVK